MQDSVESRRPFTRLRGVETSAGPIGALDNEILQAGLQMWNDLRGERRMPAPKDIDPLRIPRLALPHVTLLDVERTPEIRFRWRLIGTHITMVLDRDMTGRYWDEIYEDDILETIEKAPLQAIATGQPVQSLETAFLIDKVFLHSQSISLPLSSDGAQVDRILSFVVFPTKSQSSASKLPAS